MFYQRNSALFCLLNTEINSQQRYLQKMVRKTKEDAEITKQRIINAARSVFLSRGVSRSTLEHIAAEADVTRGAVYWHFKNKSDIFYAMRDHVFCSLIHRMDVVLSQDENSDALSHIETTLCDTIHELNSNLIMRQTYEIMMIKCEYVDEFTTVLQQLLNNCCSIIERIEVLYSRAIVQGLMMDSANPKTLALDTHMFFTGLLHMWVKDVDGTRFKPQAIALIEAHMQLRRMQLVK
jgi:TetR/AcrR family transcriptional regulator, acrAB operon repressor